MKINLKRYALASHKSQIMNCPLKLDSNIKCTFRNLPALVTEVIRSKGMNQKYKIASKHGFIKGTFPAKQLTYHKG
jgi:hypothetical protein